MADRKLLHSLLAFENDPGAFNTSKTEENQGHNDFDVRI